MTYSSIVWHFCRVADMRKIEIPEKASRVVYGDKPTSYAQFLTRGNLPSLQIRRLQYIAILMYKGKNDLIPHHIKEMFATKEALYELRHSNYMIPKFHFIFIHFIFNYLGTVAPSVHRNCFLGAVASQNFAQ